LISRLSVTHNDRIDAILRELRRKENVSLEELVKHLHSSPASVRRDLAKLEIKGLVRRTPGGATLVEPLLYEPFRYDSLFQNREQHRAAEKRRIGLAAAELIQENETVGFTAGTTTTHVARTLRNRHNIRVITNAVNIAMELSNCEGLRTFVTGGFVQWAGSSVLGASAASAELRSCDLCNKGCTAVEDDPDSVSLYRVCAVDAGPRVSLRSRTSTMRVHARGRCALHAWQMRA
jgi:DeoR/GlpR family transcriptional regulator of sugar metabolism